MALLRKAPLPDRRRSNPRRHRTPARFALLVFRGSLIWFAIVFVLVGMLAGAVGQNMLPTLFGIGLLAVYGFTYLLAAR
jgi:membrane protein DedA with SNARE-associated domain